MAKYDIAYACGHEGHIDVQGANKQREWRIKNAASGLCPDCLRAAREAGSAAASEAAAVRGYADLKGSPRQVGWAERIRADAIKSIMDTRENNAFVTDMKVSPEIKGMAVDVLKGIDSAQWFIESRHWYEEGLIGLLLSRNGWADQYGRINDAGKAEAAARAQASL